MDAITKISVRRYCNFKLLCTLAYLSTVSTQGYTSRVNRSSNKALEASVMTVSAASTTAANMTTTSSTETNETTAAAPIVVTTVSPDIIDAQCE